MWNIHAFFSIRFDLLETESMQSVQDLATAVQRVVGNVEKVIMGKAEVGCLQLDCRDLPWACIDRGCAWRGEDGAHQGYCSLYWMHF